MRATRLYRSSLERMIAKATQAGIATRDGPSMWTIVYADRCLHPVHRELFSCYDIEKQPKAIAALGNRGPLTVAITVKCRKCEVCLAQRRRLWKRRAKTETERAKRTWFGTLTLSPTEHNSALARCRADLYRQGLDYDQLSYKEQFAMLHAIHGKQITAFLKRIREETSAPLRFLLVCEAHQSGLPHYHLLLHEQDELQPVRKRTLQAQWTQGFSAWKLVSDVSQATYLCKYLAKTTAARVRASLHYGATLENDLTS